MSVEIALLLLRRRRSSVLGRRVLPLLVVYALLRDVRGFGVAEVGIFSVGVICVVAAVRFSVQPADFGDFFVPVGADVVVVAVFFAAGGFDFATVALRTLFEEVDFVVAVDGRYDTPSTQFRRLGRSAKRCAIRALAPQDGRFIVVPVPFAPFEAAVLGPEEEPDAGEDHAEADEAEERENAAIVNIVGVKGAGARFGVLLRRGGVTRCEVGTCFEGGHIGGAFG